MTSGIDRTGILLASDAPPTAPPNLKGCSLIGCPRFSARALVSVKKANITLQHTELLGYKYTQWIGKKSSCCHSFKSLLESPFGGN